jgi:hypothetical protein
MAVFVSVFGFFMVLVGIVWGAVPAKLNALVAGWRSSMLLPWAVAARIALGILFLVAAPYCRAPGVVRIVGILALAAALGLVAMGPGRFQRFFSWWIERPPGFSRLLALVAVVFGVLVIWAGGWPA